MRATIFSLLLVTLISSAFHITMAQLGGRADAGDSSDLVIDKRAPPPNDRAPDELCQLAQTVGTPAPGCG
ncbi:hypothetical protein BCR43DRAFT_492712 [Syncephalastrum racemosum]|uniref:Uncharacterized protein n=1 Tax=Syncephalastrum racemosum TaxID=13706 RepID=A0A1X2H9C0_SYNRA|nr:hypothetical protein BCR43DRAFT_492712 [Syncephalastrum racemosum]